MCDSCEFLNNRAADMVEVAILLIERMEATDKDDTCCEDSRDRMLRVFVELILDVNEVITAISFRISSAGTDEEKEILKSTLRRYGDVVLDSLLGLVETQLKERSVSVEFDWRNVLGDLVGKKVSIDLDDFK